MYVLDEGNRAVVAKLEASGHLYKVKPIELTTTNCVDFFNWILSGKFQQIHFPLNLQLKKTKQYFRKCSKFYLESSAVRCALSAVCAIL
jgi:hypothetical protein